MQLDCVDDRPKPNLHQKEEEEEGWVPTFLSRTSWEEQIQMITLQPVSQVKVAGIGDAGEQKEDWHQQD